MLKEDSGTGQGFLAEMCHAWEEATLPAIQQGIRVVTTRLGIVLSPTCGAFAKMLLPFRLGLGGMIGTGNAVHELGDTRRRAWGNTPWTNGTDMARGPLNVTAPQPVTNSEFTTTLGRVLRRPTARLPLPASVARLVLGEMADELLLSSARVMPQQLLDTHYPFCHPEFCSFHLCHAPGKV